MKVLLLLLAFLPTASPVAPPLYICREVNASLYSEAPIENIEATSVKGFAVINSGNGEVQFNIPIRSFQFNKSLMQEHFNENYMESDKFPYAKFKGKINEAVDFSKNGEHAVTVTGELEVHGVKKPRTIAGLIKINDQKIAVLSTFNVLCKDHDIKIPKLVFKNIAESIRITIRGTFTPNASKP